MSRIAAGSALSVTGDSDTQSEPLYAHKTDRWSSHTRILAALRGLPPGTRVLEIGSATGIFGQQVRGSGLVLSGLEPNQQWADLARHHYARFLCSTLEDAPDSFLADHQVVVCADVLEHMVNPEAALRRLVQLQGPGSLFLISLPNVANLWVRLNVLAGRFEYTDRGILDRTHLRFFTRSSAVRMVESAGLTITRIETTPVPLDQAHDSFANTAVGRGVHACVSGLTRLFPTLLGYQFVLLATRGN